jgi:hypothetical protein
MVVDSSVIIRVEVEVTERVGIAVLSMLVEEIVVDSSFIV